MEYRTRIQVHKNERPDTSSDPVEDKTTEKATYSQSRSLIVPMPPKVDKSQIIE